MSTERELDAIDLPEGALIHIGGMPFWLTAPTTVAGRIENYKLVSKEHLASRRCWCKPILLADEHAEGDVWVHDAQESHQPKVSATAPATNEQNEEPSRKL